MANPPLRQLSVKVDEYTEDELKERAKRAGTTLSDYARRILKEAVKEESELARLRLAVTASQRETLKLRRDIANGIEAILVSMAADQPLSPQQAKNWVDAKLRGKAG